jgi:hypothetical protein
MYNICIDFDGTIVEEEYPEIGKLKAGAKEIINSLSKNFNIIIHTCRINPEICFDIEKEKIRISNFFK